MGADGTVSDGWLRVSHREDKNALELEISDGLSPVGKEVVKRVRRQFDLDQNPDEIHEQLKTLGQIREGLPVLGTRIPGAFEPFEMAVRAILGQQITVTFARSLADRLTATYGTPVDTGQPGLTYIFPTPEKIASLSDGIEDHLGKLGVLSARSRTIATLAEGMALGELDLDHPEDPAEQMQKLLAIKGIGPWTAGYIAMRTLGMKDVFLETDAGIKKAVAPLAAKEAARVAEQWRPWRSYATFGLWASL